MIKRLDSEIFGYDSDIFSHDSEIFRHNLVMIPLSSLMLLEIK